MIPRNAEAVSNDTPYKRIEIGSSRGVGPRNVTEAAPYADPAERDRIWNLIVRAAQDGIGNGAVKAEDAA